MKKEEVIKRFCILSAEVGDFLATKQKKSFARDCFCDEAKESDDRMESVGFGRLLESNFQFEDPILRFIEEAVKDRMER